MRRCRRRPVGRSAEAEGLTEAQPRGHTPPTVAFSFSDAPPCECDWFARSAAEPNIPVVFDAGLNEYHLLHGGSADGAYSLLWYCPFCGGAAPKSRRQELFLLLTVAESSRLAELVDPLRTIADVIQAFGKPDEDLDPGDGCMWPASSSAPSTFERGRTLVYRGLSRTADVRATEGADGRVRFSFSGKPVVRDSEAGA